MKKDQSKTPLYDAIRAYGDADVAPLHIPAHKMGAGIHPKWRKELGDDVFRMDLTEVIGLDDLHQPNGVIQEAQDLAADAYGADESFFLVNGTSGGIVASICTAAAPGEKIIIPRNAHKSVVYGLIVSGAVPVYLSPEIQTEKGLVGGFLPGRLEETYRDHPDAKAVYSVSPTYHGICSDTKSLIEITHRHGGLFIADEAHGNHVCFSPKLPDSALELGADLACQSTHKMSGSLGQSSILHLKGDRVDRTRLRANLQLTQTTSPSYLLMASLDVARSYMATDGLKLLGELMDRIDGAKEKIKKIPGIEVLGTELIGSHGIADYEPTRLVISARQLGIEGYELFRLLRRNYGIELEFGDYFYAVGVLGPGTQPNHLDRLVHALEDLARQHVGGRPPLVWEEELPEVPPMVATPREAYFAKTRTIPWEEARGQVSGQLIVPYPPGIPAVCPGELITPSVFDYLEYQRQKGRHLHGADADRLDIIRIMERG